MSFGRQKSESESNDPRLTQAYLDNLDRARGVAEGLGPKQFAERTPDFEQGTQAMRSAFGFGDQPMAGQGQVDKASQAAGQVANYNPQDVQAGSFLQGDMAQYMSPYQDQVIDAALGDLNRSRQMAMNDVGDQAANVGAFGGSRQAVLEAETNRGFADQAGDLASQMRQQGFDTGANLMQQDLARQMQAATANQQAGLQGAQQNLAGAGLLSQLGDQQMNRQLQGAEGMMNLGLNEQQFNQQQLDAIRNMPLERQQFINQALGIVPGGTGGTSGSSGFNIGVPTPGG